MSQFSKTGEIESLIVRLLSQFVIDKSRVWLRALGSSGIKLIPTNMISLYRGKDKPLP